MEFNEVIDLLNETAEVIYEQYLKAGKDESPRLYDRFLAITDAVDLLNDQAQKIGELEEHQREIATLHSILEKQRQQIEVLEHWRPEWIPTRVNMPKEGQIVLVVTPEYTDGEGNEYTEGVQCAYWHFPRDPKWFSSDGVTYGNGGMIVAPTHWIELPIPPKDGEQE